MINIADSKADMPHEIETTVPDSLADYPKNTMLHTPNKIVWIVAKGLIDHEHMDITEGLVPLNQLVYLVPPLW
jgi:hypothetical protein